MGTGVGEAMLIGAVTGAGTSAVTGGDPLKGALLGAAGGGLGAGIAGAGAGATSGAAGAAPISTTAAGSGAGIGTGTAAGASASPYTLAGAGQAGIGATGTAAGASSPFSMAGTSQAGFGTSAVNPITGMPASASIDPFSVAYVDPLAGSQIGAETAGQVAGTPTFPKIADFYAKNPIMMPAGLGAATSAAFSKPPGLEEEDESGGPLSDFRYSRGSYTPYRAASGGLMDTAVARRMAGGGHLGSYSDGGQLLKGREADSNGMKDDIPASIEGSQPALLADGEFVIPADVVSGLGNGSTEAGARELYAMMEKVRAARTGRSKQAPEIDADKMMPA